MTTRTIDKRDCGSLLSNCVDVCAPLTITDWTAPSARLRVEFALGVNDGTTFLSN